MFGEEAHLDIFEVESRAWGREGLASFAKADFLFSFLLDCSG
jgi:hypothetical protein